MSKISIKNTARGLRGVHTVDGFLYVEPGKTADVEVDSANLAAVKAKSYFELSGEQETDEPEPEGEQGDGLDDKTVAELDQIIADESVAVPEQGTGNDGRVVKADKVAAIRAKRAAPAIETSDELDAMSDDDLRATVAAITGTEPAADADRATLLTLARGETPGA